MVSCFRVDFKGNGTAIESSLSALGIFCALHALVFVWRSTR